MLDGEVWPPLGLLVVQVIARSAAAFATMLRDLIEADAFLARAVEVVVVGNLVVQKPAGLLRRADAGLAQGMAMRDVGDFERSIGAVIRTGQARIALAFTEERQHIIEAPPGAA